MEQSFHKAVRFFEAGKLKKARKCLEDIQRQQPDILEVRHLLSLIALREGGAAEAVGHLQAAVRLAPGSADLFGLLGAALRKDGRADEALAAFEQALAINPGLDEVHYNMGNTLKDMERPQDAITCYQRAVEQNPAFADAYVNLGLTLKKTGQFHDAAAAYRGAIEINPKDAWAHTNLGNVLQELGQADEAVTAHRQAVELHPETIEYSNNLAGALVESGLLEEAVEVFLGGLKTAPDSLELICGLGTAYVALGKTDDAKAAYREALNFAADDPMARYLLGRVHLLEGNLAQGWQGVEARWQAPSLGMRKMDLPQPPWRGTLAKDKTILVWGEQGVGDEVMSASMIPDLIAQEAKVIMECDNRLIPLFKRSFDGIECIPRNDPPSPQTRQTDIDFQIPSGGLGLWLRPDLNAFPDRRQYLFADPDRRQALRERYTPGIDTGNLLIGIAWDSKNPKFGWQKSMSLMVLEPLAHVPGILLIDLQYGDTGDERGQFEAKTGVAILHDHEVDQMTDLDSFAAQVAAMDLIISISNTTVHLSGALGIPTWVLLNAVPLNCWMLERGDSPWYPSVKLFRQSRAGVWADVIERVANELEKFKIG